MSRSAGSSNSTLTVSNADVPAAPVISGVVNAGAGSATATVVRPTLDTEGNALATPVSTMHLFWSLSELPTDNRLLFGADTRIIKTTSAAVTAGTVAITATDLTLGAIYYFVAVADNA